jgi:hypothetical protein
MYMSGECPLSIEAYVDGESVAGTNRDFYWNPGGSYSDKD